MPTYVYKARDPAGKAVKGSMQASSKDELYEKLHKLGYMTTEAREGLSVAELQSLIDLWQPVHSEDLIVFYVQLANLIHAGIPMVESLNTVSQQVENKKLREIVESVTRSVEGGESLSEALSQHPKIFSYLFVSLVKAGEISGKLDVILNGFATYAEEQAELRQKITSAFFYPAILLAAGIAVSFFMVTFLVPQFAQIFMRVGIPLPFPTLVLYRLALTLKYFWHSLLLLALVVGLGFQYYAGTEGGELWVDQWKLRLPLLGRLFRKLAISRMGRTLGMLVSSGVPFLQSLEMTREVVGNEVLARALEAAHEAVEKGERFSESLRVSREFPPDVIRMIAVGEETGNLDEMLEKVADFYDRSVNYAIKKITTLIEPLLLILLGCLVGFIMASMLLPMFDMIKVIKQTRQGF